MSEINSFDPVDYSVQECQFLIGALGKPPIVAMAEVPAKVNPKAVKPILDRVYELLEMQKHNPAFQWVGVPALVEKLEAYLRENARWKADNKRFRKAPRFPSMYSFDSKGRAHRGGIGSDSGRVRSYFSPDGERVRFEIPLFNEFAGEWAPPGFTEKSTSGGLVVDDVNNRIECKVCGHTESFKPESRASYSAARARMSKHLRKATDKVDEHREIHTAEFS